MKKVGMAEPMPGTPAFTMCAFDARKVPTGTCLFVDDTDGSVRHAAVNVVVEYERRFMVGGKLHGPIDDAIKMLAKWLEQT